MANFFGMGGSMFGTSGTNNWMGGMSNLYADYNAIRNGSYRKLLKAYYGQDSSAKSRVQDVVSKKKTNAENKELTEAKADATELKDSASALSASGSKSLFNKKEIKTKDENGKEITTMGYDREAIEKAVTSFVDDYNSAITSGSKVNSTNMLRKTLQMTQMTQANKRMLSDVGINITSGNKLSVDKDTLGKADMNKLKSLFEGSGSYAGRISDKASQIAQAAVTEFSKNSSLYTNSGNYNNKQNYSSVFDYFY